MNDIGLTTLSKVMKQSKNKCKHGSKCMKETQVAPVICMPGLDRCIFYISMGVVHNEGINKKLLLNNCTSLELLYNSIYKGSQSSDAPVWQDIILEKSTSGDTHEKNPNILQAYCNSTNNSIKKYIRMKCENEWQPEKNQKGKVDKMVWTCPQ